jgi:hypothetical protein
MRAFRGHEARRMSEFFYEFEVSDHARFKQLQAFVAALRVAKLSGQWQDETFWRPLYGSDAPPWGVRALIDSFERGEFVLVGCRRVSKRLGRLSFDPFACPYGGDCMRHLIEWFGHRILRESGA